MMKKMVSLFVIFILLLSIFAIAQEDIYEDDTYGEDTSGVVEECGFWCKVGQFFFGNPENRAGRGWFDRSALVGEAAAKNAQAQQLYDEGKALYNQGKYPEAINKFQRANAIEPSSGPKIYLARSYEKMGNQKRALEAYTETRDSLIPKTTRTAMEADRLVEANAGIQKLSRASSPQFNRGDWAETKSEGKVVTQCVNSRGCFYGEETLSTGDYVAKPLAEVKQFIDDYDKPTVPQAASAPSAASTAQSSSQPVPVPTPVSTQPFNSKDWVERTDKKGKIYSECIVEKCYYSGLEIKKGEYVENSISGMEAVEKLPAPQAVSAPSEPAEPASASPPSARPMEVKGQPIEGTHFSVDEYDIIYNVAGNPVTDKNELNEIKNGKYESAYEDALEEAKKTGEEAEKKAEEEAKKEEVEGKEPSAKAKKETVDINFEKKYDKQNAYATQLENIAKKAEDAAKGAKEQRLGQLQTAKKELETANKALETAGEAAKNAEEKAKVATQKRLGQLEAAQKKLASAKEELEKAGTDADKKKAAEDKITEANTKVEALSKESDPEKAAKEAKKAAEDEVAEADAKVKELSKESDLEKDASKTKKAAEEARKDTDSIKYQWSFTDGMNQWRKDTAAMQVVTTVFQSLQGLLSRTSAYQGLSNLLFPEETQKWIDKSNTEFLNIWADLPSYVASHIDLSDAAESCSADDARRSEIPGQSTAFVRTQSGTYQFVGSIQAEKSATKSKMLCERNPDEEAEEEFICSSGLVCKEDQFCYESEDAEEPAEGYFYKITWGVTAPQDEKFTPYIDENGIAIRFNLALSSPGSGEKWIFKRAGGYGANVITLTNGARDGGTIVKYLRKEYTRVCIKFDPPNSVIDYFGDEVNEICTDFVTSTGKSVEYSASGSVPTTSSTSEQVTMDI